MYTLGTNQVGGDHYTSEYQHWDYVVDSGMGYLEGSATAYVTRYRKKNGIEDLKKALTYLNKLEQCYQRGQLKRFRLSGDRRVYLYRQHEKFETCNKLTPQESLFVQLLVLWDNVGDLRAARDVLLKLMDAAEPLPEAQLPVSEPVPVPLTEENHYSPRVGDQDED